MAVPLGTNRSGRAIARRHLSTKALDAYRHALYFHLTLGDEGFEELTIIGEGQSPKMVPEEIKGWSWGGFLLNWIWGVGNNTYIALLTFIPFFGILIMPFVLGAKGNEWAWRNGRWDSIEHFRRVQRRWALWGFAILALGICLLGFIFGGVLYALTTSDAYKMGVAQLQHNRAATEALGLPISTGFPLGSIDLSGQSGEAVMNFSASGGKASGRVVLQAEKSDGIWSLTFITLVVNGSNRSIDLLNEDHASRIQYDIKNVTFNE